jgi:hypothetical protein
VLAKEKLTDIGFTCSVFKDVGNLLLDGIVDIGWFVALSYSINFITNLGGGKTLDKRETAHFTYCGNYFPGS